MVQREDTDAKQAVEVLAVNLICGLMNVERKRPKHTSSGLVVLPLPIFTEKKYKDGLKGFSMHPEIKTRLAHSFSVLRMKAFKITVCGYYNVLENAGFFPVVNVIWKLTSELVIAE